MASEKKPCLGQAFLTSWSIQLQRSHWRHQVTLFGLSPQKSTKGKLYGVPHARNDMIVEELVSKVTMKNLLSLRVFQM